jgi:hypothetical protein
MLVDRSIEQFPAVQPPQVGISSSNRSESCEPRPVSRMQPAPIFERAESEHFQCVVFRCAWAQLSLQWHMRHQQMTLSGARFCFACAADRSLTVVGISGRNRVLQIDVPKVERCSAQWTWEPTYAHPSQGSNEESASVSISRRRPPAG